MEINQEIKLVERDCVTFLFPQVHRVAVDVARALAYLHGDQLLMHGDLKSGNVLVFGDDFETVKLCDFGVALGLRSPDGPVEAGQFYVGTQAWSAPEVIAFDEGPGNQSAATITAKADIFSYGLTVW